MLSSIKTQAIKTHELWPRITDRRVVALFFLGLGAGIPLLMIFSSLSLWLKQAGVARAEITFFSWAALGYGFKYVWAPILDQIPFPLLGKLLGQRRGWLIISQIMVIASIVGMALIDPAHHLAWMAVFAVMLGFSSATQDIVIDAYRIEIADNDLQGMLSASYIAGYRVAMIISGGLLLELVAYFQTNSEIYSYQAWQIGYLTMGLVMVIPIITVFMIREPDVKPAPSHSSSDYLKFISAVMVAVASLIGVFYLFGRLDWEPTSRYLRVGFEFLRLASALGAGFFIFALLMRLHFVPKPLVEDGYVRPVTEFFSRYPLMTIIILLLTIGFYRAPDIIMGTSANIFYDDLGFDLVEIGRISKTFGLIMTIIGGFIAGGLMLWLGVTRMLLIGVALAAGTNLLFSWLATIGANINALIMVIAADNLSSGLASVAFVAWLSRLTNIQFTAMQYAIFSSLMVVGPKFIGGYSGGMIDAMGYQAFYSMTAAIGIPVFILVWFATNLERKTLSSQS